MTYDIGNNGSGLGYAQNMDELNCVGIHCFAELHSCSELQQKSKDFILHHFPRYKQQASFTGIISNKLAADKRD
jgi:hypothetical protein